jgi:hypothetical protein
VSTTSSAWRATRLWIVWWSRWRTMCVHVAPRPRHRSSAGTARPATAPGPGAASETGRCPYRGNHTRIGYPLRRDKHRQRQCPMALRQPVLRAPRLEFDRPLSFPAGPNGHLGDQRPAPIRIDVARDTLNVHLHPDGIARQFANGRKGHAGLIAWLTPLALASRRRA